MEKGTRKFENCLNRRASYKRWLLEKQGLTVSLDSKTE